MAVTVLVDCNGASRRTIENSKDTIGCGNVTAGLDHVCFMVSAASLASFVAVRVDGIEWLDSLSNAATTFRSAPTLRLWQRETETGLINDVAQQ